MASLKEIRNRIQSVKKTQKTTNAMQMVSAAKLKRAQDAIESAQPYSHQLQQVVAKMSTRFSEEDHPLFLKTSGAKIAVILITSDRGLCGSFNVNLCKQAVASAEALQAESLRFTTIGRKGREFVQRTSYDIHKSYAELSPRNLHSVIEEVIRQHVEWFQDKEIDQVFLAFNHFENVLSQPPQWRKLLPIEPDVKEEESDERDVIFEPSPQEILEQLLRKYVENQVHTAVLSSVAGEHASRMTAMDSATKNAGEMIKKLQLFYNRTRQAAITRELIEIVSGAESL